MIINPKEVFGDTLLETTKEMLKECVKSKREITNDFETVSRVIMRNNLPKWMIYHYCEHSGLDYEEYWNDRACENLAKWYSIEENILENKEWEEKYENAKNYDIKIAMRDLIQKGNARRPISCPFHKDKTPSLQIYENTNSWYCFSCSRGGSAIDYIMHKHNLDFKEAVNFLSTH